MSSELIVCKREHIPAIAQIINDNIARTTNLYDYNPRTVETVQEWFNSQEKNGFPIIGYEDASGNLIGYASYGLFKTLPGYKFTVEHSVYVADSWTGKGFGKKLLQNIMLLIERNGYHTTIGVIDSANLSSIGLHLSLGFHLCGTLKQVGYKFGQWLDVNFYQYIFNEPIIS